MLERTAYSERDPSMEVGSSAQPSGAAPSGEDIGSLLYRRWANEIDSRIGRLQQLAEDWDTNGGAPVSQKVAERALWILEWLGPTYETPQMYPLSTGGLLMEWESPDAEVALEVRSPYSVSVLIESDGQIEKESVALLPGKLITECFDLLSERIPRRTL